jgi:hypothetical protein
MSMAGILARFGVVGPKRVTDRRADSLSPTTVEDNPINSQPFVKKTQTERHALMMSFLIPIDDTGHVDGED